MNPNHLTPGHLLHQRYSIQYSLGQGGFGITYLAYDQKLDQEVCIKELFVAGNNTRGANMTVHSQTTGDFSFSDFVQRFIEEARQLARFRHPNIVRVIDYFEENNTAYMVMEYVEGKTLKQKVQREGALSEEEALALMHQLLDAVEEVHNAGLLHRDITPDNILISQKGRVVLIDFGSAREFAEGKTSTQTAMLKPGYAPAEQYSNRSKRGKYTDIYALGATLYFLLTAQKPIASTDRISEDLIPPHRLNPKVSSQVSSAVMLAMEMKPENRFRDVAEMREAIKTLQQEHKKVKPPPEKEKEADPEKNRKPKRTKNRNSVILLFAAIAIIGIGVFWNNKISLPSFPHRTTEKIVASSTEIIDVSSIADNMILVEGGDYTMGCSAKHGSECNNDERPVHQVTLSGFYMSKYEVTQGQWREVMGDNPSLFGDCDNCPVENVSWYDVQEFIQKLNQKTGKNYRLPTEAEWEFAAQGGRKSAKYKFSGGNNMDEVGWYENNSHNRTQPVGQKKPNELGLYDMSGNVWEWCSDWYAAYSDASQTNPRGPLSGSSRVMRGGSWFLDSKLCRISSRSGLTPVYSSNRSGFRLVYSIEEHLDNSTSLNIIEELSDNLVFIAGGTFTMGCTSEQGSDCESVEQPAHQVSLSGFYMSKYEVTQAQWKAVMGNNPSYYSGCDNCPVEQVSWDDVQEFIRKLNQMTGKNYRLPTEAEWEYAARGGSKSIGYKYSGSSSIDQVAWYNINSGSKTHPVGQKQPNELGLYDMTGNVLEWCSDWYSAYSTSAQSNPKGPTSGSRRIRRGGSFNFNTQFSRLTFRHSFSPESVFSYLGFRLVLSDSDNDNFKTEDEPSIEDSQSQIQFIGDNMVYVYGGTFSMGCTAEQGSNCEGDERPAHQVSLSGFYMSKYEVTQAQWREVMGSKPSYFKNCDNCPVDQVSWDDVQKFIRKLNQMTGKSYRLPTEAEWEFAARGGNKSRGYKYSGSNSIDQVAWYDGNSGGKTHPVGQKQPNELGLYDMTGNVWEWCSDWYGDYSFASQTNSKGPTSGSYRVNRGGSYSYYSQRCRVSYRNYFHPDFRYDYLGFRLVSAQ